MQPSILLLQNIDSFSLSKWPSVLRQQPRASSIATIFLFVCLFVGLFVALIAPAQAEFTEPDHVAAYSPANVGGDHPLKLQPCKAIAASPGIYIGGHFSCDTATIEAGAMEKNDRLGQYQVNVKINAKKRYRISGKGLDFGFLDTVHSVDLNGDNQPDYILEFSFHGVGLAAVRRTMVFVFSGPEYSWQVIEGLVAPAARHFYKTAEGDITYLTTRMASDAVKSMPSSSDKRSHTFWVFEPIVMSKANGLWAHIPKSNYPVWVQYKNKPHNQPTELISLASQKRATLSPVRNTRGGKMQPLG